MLKTDYIVPAFTRLLRERCALPLYWYNNCATYLMFIMFLGQWYRWWYFGYSKVSSGWIQEWRYSVHWRYALRTW